MVRIKLNGEDWEVSENTTVSNLISSVKIRPDLCVVEKNGQIIARNEYAQVVVGVDDQIEIVRFMAGG